MMINFLYMDNFDMRGIMCSTGGVGALFRSGDKVFLIGLH